VTGRYRISVTKDPRDSRSRSLYVVNEVALGMALAISEESNSGTLTILEQACPTFLVVWATSANVRLLCGQHKVQYTEC
jgi:hypothetical protein